MQKLITTLIITLMLVGCSNENILKPDTTMNTAYLMKFHIDNQNYYQFQSLFNNYFENTVSKETFQQFGQITTAGTNFKNFELLTFDNGEMLLVEFQPKFEEDDEYKIVNVKLVPDEMKALFLSN